MFVAEEEHKGNGIVEFCTESSQRLLPTYFGEELLLTIHLFEVGNLIEITNVNNGKVLDAICNTCGEGVNWQI